MKKALFFKITIIVIGAITVFAACKKGPVTITPPSTSTTFNRLVIDGNVKVHLEPSSTNKVDTAVAGVIVRTSINKTAFISGAGEITVYINDVDSIIANGKTELLAPNVLALTHLVLIANGWSSTDINLNVHDSLTFLANGTGPYKLKGASPEFRLITSGFSYISAFDLITKNTDVKLYGANKAEVYATNSLKVFIAGLGTVYYKGNPTTVTPVTIGLGQLVKK